MTYMNTADIYLGDVSSQVCEFIFEPRSCIFLNPNNIKWDNENGLEMWELGEVINNFNFFDEVLKNSQRKHRSFIETQKKFFATRCAYKDTKSGYRGARVIVDYLSEPSKNIKHD